MWNPMAAHGFRVTKGSCTQGPLGLPPRELQWVCTTGDCGFWHIQKWRLIVPEDLLKREDCKLSALGQNFGYGHFCSDTGEKKPHGGPVYTEPFPLTGGGATPSRQGYLRNSVQAPSPEDSLEEQVYGKPMDSSNWGKYYTELQVFPQDSLLFQVQIHYFSFSYFFSFLLLYFSHFN